MMVVRLVRPLMALESFKPTCCPKAPVGRPNTPSRRFLFVWRRPELEVAITEITVEAFQTALAECADAIDSSDFATAWLRYAKAEAIHSGLLVQSGEQDAYMRRRESLEGLRRALAAAESSAGRYAVEGRIIVGTTRYPGGDRV